MSEVSVHKCEDQDLDPPYLHKSQILLHECVTWVSWGVSDSLIPRACCPSL